MHLQKKEKVVQCEEPVYSIRRVRSGVGKQGVCCEEKVCIIRNVALVLPIEKVFSTRRVAFVVERREHL